MNFASRPACNSTGFLLGAVLLDAAAHSMTTQLLHAMSAQTMSFNPS
jgi:hypothetical protein